MIGRTATLKVKSEALGIMFIAMVFTAGIFSATSSNTSTAHIENLIKFEVGADLVAEVDPSFRNITLQFLDRIKNIDGVADVSAMLVTYAWITYRTIGLYTTLTHNRTIPLYGVQPSKWTDTAFFLPSFTKVNSPKENLLQIEENKYDVISSFMPIEGYEFTSDQTYNPVYSNQLKMKINEQINDTYFEIKIIDIMSEDESTDSLSYLPGESEATDFLITNLDLLHEKLNTSRVNRFFVKFTENANYTEIIRSINAIAPYSFIRIESAHEKIDGLLGSRSARTINGVYTLSILFSLIYLTIGMCIVTIQKNQIFRKQFSVLRAMGLNRKSIQITMLIDAGLTIVLASIIGFFIGIFLTYLILGTPLTYIGISETRTWNRLPVVIAVPYELLSIILITSYAIPMIGAYFITRYNLRFRIADELQVPG